MNQPANSGQSISDDEIVAHLYRLATTGRYFKYEFLLAEAELAYPAESKTRIVDCMKRLGELIWKNNHCGYARECKSIGSKPKSSNSLADQPKPLSQETKPAFSELL